MNQTLLQPKPARPAGPVRRWVQRTMYRWHRTVGIVTVVPVICWTLSGLAHPFMSNWFRPKIAREFVPPAAAPRPAVPLGQVLARHGISSVRNVRLVRWQQEPAYQILAGVDSATAAPRYFSAATSRALPPDADRQFAEQLARYFTQDSVARVASATRITAFSQEYPVVNRLLPVWRVQLARPDGLTVYVETMPVRLAAFNTDSRRAFLWVFGVLHNWSWLESIGNHTVRVLVMAALLSVIVLSAVSGLVIYGFMWQKFRRPRGPHDRVGWLRRYHRQVGLAVALVTFTFAFSGAWHVLLKLRPDERLRYHHAPAVPAAALVTDLTALQLDWARVQHVALAAHAGRVYYQITELPPADAAAPNGPRPSGASTGQPIEAVQAPRLTYYDAASGRPAPAETGLDYARFLANTFLAQADRLAPAAVPAITKTELIDHFEGEYGFVNKRLPVVKVAYDTPQKTTLYVEPATGRLAARVENADRYEGLSFAFLHKYHSLGKLGKTVRDAVTMLAAAGVLAVSLLGVWLWAKGR